MEHKQIEEEMNREEIIEKLRDDEFYYGPEGKKFLSASMLGTLINKPWEHGAETKHSSALTIGRYMHMCILEEDKLDMFEVKDLQKSSPKEWTIAQKDVDNCHAIRDKILGNEFFHDLIRGGNVVYEEPGLVDIDGYTFKGKADIINHDKKLIVDLKTTGSIDRFGSSAYTYGYNSQAYIYQKMFGYSMVFVVADKSDHRLGYYTCSDKFLGYGKARIDKAMKNYELIKSGYNFEQYYVEKEL